MLKVLTKLVGTVFFPTVLSLVPAVSVGQSNRPRYGKCWGTPVSCCEFYEFQIPREDTVFSMITSSSSNMFKQEAVSVSCTSAVLQCSSFHDLLVV